MKKISIITVFPEYFEPLLNCGVVGQALRGERGEHSFQFEVLNLRDFALDNYKSVDDAPYGGGPGMVMKADVFKNALVKGIIEPNNYQNIKEQVHVVYTSPRGELWHDQSCREFAHNHLNNDQKHLVFICGRYEGIDERFLQQYVDQQICIGDFVLSGGELAVMSILDSALRFSPAVLGNKDSAHQDSFSNCLIEYPQYTRPAEFETIAVPEILMSGHHAKINEYRQKESERLTKELRPDLYMKFKERK